MKLGEKYMSWLFGSNNTDEDRKKYSRSFDIFDTVILNNWRAYILNIEYNALNNSMLRINRLKF